MADLYSVTAPLMLRRPDGSQQCIAECFPTEDGLLYFDLYWHIGRPEVCMHEIKGRLSGDGPWKIEGHVFNVLGCQGTDPELAGQWAAWEGFLQRADSEYPPRPLVEAIARRMGALAQARSS